jgi:uncharacterized protein HemX
MNKSLLILAALALAFSFSFAGKGKEKKHETRQEQIEQSRQNRLVCENGQTVVYRGNRRATEEEQSYGVYGGNLEDKFAFASKCSGKKRKTVKELKR